jgi:hypothetical protein
MVNKTPVCLPGTADVQSQQMAYSNTCVAFLCFVCVFPSGLFLLVCISFSLRHFQFLFHFIFFPFSLLIYFLLSLFFCSPFIMFCIRTYVVPVQLLSVYTFASDLFYQLTDLIRWLLNKWFSNTAIFCMVSKTKKKLSSLSLGYYKTIITVL